MTEGRGTQEHGKSHVIDIHCNVLVGLAPAWRLWPHSRTQKSDPAHASSPITPMAKLERNVSIACRCRHFVTTPSPWASTPWT
jgi:hypothetical protein